MAEYLRNPAKPVTMAAFCMLLVSFQHDRAAAQTLRDPTRPPASIGSPADQSGAKATGGPELQSVLISPTRRVAVIDGQTVTLGEKFGEARVVKIAESEVVLRNGQDLQVLKLFPGVEKQRKSNRPSDGTKDAVVKVR